MVLRRAPALPRGGARLAPTPPGARPYFVQKLPAGSPVFERVLGSSWERAERRRYRLEGAALSRGNAPARALEVVVEELQEGELEPLTLRLGGFAEKPA